MKQDNNTTNKGQIKLNTWYFESNLKRQLCFSIANDFTEQFKARENNNFNWHDVFSTQYVKLLVDFNFNIDTYYNLKKDHYEGIKVSDLLSLYDHKEINFFIQDNRNNIEILILILRKIHDKLFILEEPYQEYFKNSSEENNFIKFKYLIASWKYALLEERSKYNNNFSLPNKKPNKIYLYHIDKYSKNSILDTTFTFKPAIPETAGEYEDNSQKRICFSTNIIGCINGIGGYMLDPEAQYNIFIMEVDKDDPRLKLTKDIMKDNLVYDAFLSNEVWWTEEVTLKSSLIQFNYYNKEEFELTFSQIENLYNQIIERKGLTEEQLQNMDIGKLILTELQANSDKYKIVLKSSTYVDEDYTTIFYDLDYEWLSQPVINKPNSHKPNTQEIKSSPRTMGTLKLG